MMLPKALAVALLCAACGCASTSPTDCEDAMFKAEMAAGKLEYQMGYATALEQRNILPDNRAHLDTATASYEAAYRNSQKVCLEAGIGK